MFKTENELINYIKQEKDWLTWQDIQDIVCGFILSSKTENDNNKVLFNKENQILEKAEKIFYN